MNGRIAALNAWRAAAEFSLLKSTSSALAATSLSVANTVIRMYDDQVHQRADVEGERTQGIDQRWIRIHRPLVVVLDDEASRADILDHVLQYGPGERVYVLAAVAAETTTRDRRFGQIPRLDSIHRHHPRCGRPFSGSRA